MNIIPDQTPETLLTAGEVARMFRVDIQTVGRWARTGKLDSVRTPGGHRRFRESEVRALMDGATSGQGAGVEGVASS